MTRIITAEEARTLREAATPGPWTWIDRGPHAVGIDALSGELRLEYGTWESLAVAHDDGPKVQAGCWRGSVEATIARIEADYADDHSARDLYVAAVRAVAALVGP